MNVETVWKGKRGYYWIEVAEAADGGFTATAIGPAPGPVGPAAKVTAPNSREAVSLVIKSLEETGA